jgi:hypothetical protein
MNATDDITTEESSAVTLDHVTRTYKRDEFEVRALDDVTLDISRKSFASGHGRYGQKRPGRGAGLANEPCSFRLSGQLETLRILFMHHIIPTSLFFQMSKW